MTLEQLRVFIAVAEREHMTRAADALGLTQSAASAAVAALEGAYSTPLFHRIGRGIELTDAGRLFLDEARAVVARASAAELALAELGGLKRGLLTLGASQTIASYWLPQRLVAFRRAYPGIEIRLAIGNTAEVAKGVAAGDAEIGLVEGVVDEPVLSSKEIASDSLVLVVAPDHPWADCQSLGPGDLTQSDWVLREPGSGTRSVFETALGEMGVAPHLLKTVLELPSNEAVRAAVEASAGATAISELVVTPSLRSGALSRVSFVLPKRPFFLLRHRGRYRSKAAEALVSAFNQDSSDAESRANGPNR